MAELTIRQADDGDVAAVIELWTRCGLARPWNDPRADIDFARSGANSAILVGLAGEKLAASAMVGHDGHRGTVYYVSVDPDMRGSGYGRAIMEAAEAWLREAGAWKLNLIVRAENQRVIDFYDALGYEREERVNMAKWLDPTRRPRT